VTPEEESLVEYPTEVEKTPEEEEAELAELEALNLSESKEAREDRTYTLKLGETIWDASRKLKIDVATLLDHNDLEQATDAGAGYVLHLPKARKKEAPELRYETLEKPITMHVIKPGGAQKWFFGNAKKWTDLGTSGPSIAQNTNVEIVAVAHVPIEDKTYAYYMEAAAFRGYAETGRVKYSIGFSWQDLAEGKYEPLPLEPAGGQEQPTTVDQTQQQIPQPAGEMPPEPKPTILEEPVPPIDEYLKALEADPIFPNQFKSTYKPFEDGPCDFFVNIPDESKSFILVQDHGSNRPDKHVMRNKLVSIKGTFEKDDVLYGRPETSYWFGIPMSYLQSDEELYTIPVEVLKQKQSRRNSLSLQEKGIVAAARSYAQYTRLVESLRQKIKINKKEQ
jgi:hypothetical protein